MPFTEDFLINGASGDHFGMTQNAGMGWNPVELLRKQFVILSTAGGLREPDGAPVALGLHTGHFELATMVRAAALELREPEVDTLRAVLLRPVRRAHAGHDRDAGLAAISERRGAGVQKTGEVASDIARGDGSRVVRQGSARDDDGSGRTPRHAGGGRGRAASPWRRSMAKTPA